MVNMDDMPDVCKHPPVNWCSDMTNTVHISSHPPTSDKITYSSTPRTAEQLAAWEPGGFLSATLAAYPLLLNRYLAAKLRFSAARSRSSSVPVTLNDYLFLAAYTASAGSKLKRARYSFSEKITWREPMRG